MEWVHTVCWTLGFLTLVRAFFAVARVCYSHCASHSLLKRYGRGTWAVVTGASFGIGSGFARQLAAQGFNLVLIARSGDRLKSLAEKLRQAYGVSVEPLAMDLSDTSLCAQLATLMAGKEWTVLVNNASVLIFREFAHMTVEEVHSLVDLNVKSVAVLTHLFAVHGEPTKALINLSSLTGDIPLPMLSLYSGTKAFTKAFSEALASEGHFDVLCLSPVCVSSNMTFNLTASVLENPDSYSHSSLQTLGRVSWSAGSLQQDILHAAVGLLPVAVLRAGFKSLVRVLHLFTLEPPVRQ